MELTIGNRVFDLQKPLIMGVVNATPDSFSGDGVLDTSAAVKQAEQMVKEGAHIIDVGGESSRPGSDPVSEKEELQRVLPIVKELVKKDILVSVDTCKASVAEQCLEAGAHMINDICGGRDPNMFSVVARYDVPYVLMHMKGTPKSMQQDPSYEDVIAEIVDFFKERVALAKKAGVQQIILDPGIGFGKRVEDNLTIMRNFNAFTKLGYPTLIGASRKSFIGKITGAEVSDRLPGTLAAHVLALEQGAHIIRCHDVKEHKQAMEVAKEIITH